MTTETHIYGEWPSPIDGADVARKQVGLTFPVIDAAGVWWQESRPEEGGRLAVVRQGPDGTGTKHDLLPMPWNARTRVHEYGGKSYLPLPDGFVFANFGDQRLYRCGAAGAPEPPAPVALTPAPDGETADRFADFVLSPGGDEVWCVRERHGAGTRITRAIVAVPLDGSGAGDPGAIRILVSGSDFYAGPAPSPDGTRLAWICWDHPRMPWDGTELRVTALNGAGPVSDKAQQQLIMGGEAESVLAPVWRDDRSLYVISDRSGWWNFYVADLLDFPRALCPREEEFAGPLWQLGLSPYAVLGDGRLAVIHGTGETRLAVLDPDSGRLTDLDLPYQVFVSGVSASGQTIATIAGGPAVPTTVIGVEVPAPGGLGGIRVSSPRSQHSSGREPAGPRAEPEHRLAAGSRLPADAAGGPADRAVGFGRARDRLPAGQPRGPGARRRAAALHRLGARRPHLAGRPPAGPGEGLFHQPRHRHHRRELRRVQRVRPGLPRAAARPVGRRGRGRRDDGRAGPGRVGRG